MGKTDTIEIIRDGKVLGRIHFGDTVAGAAALLGGKCFMVCDSAVRHFATALETAVQEGREAGVTAESAGSHVIENAGQCGVREQAEFIGSYVIENVSEEGKTIETVQDICRRLLESGADRDATLVAVGGGILTDIAGFAAAVYKRGIRCAYIPTTLLAQVDAAIGGKTGVNLDSYKNIMGVFRQPEFTYICPEVMQSLPPAVFRSGLAELLKTFIIDNGGGGVEKLTATVRKINAAGGFSASDPQTRAEFGDLVAQAATVKAGVVSRDEFEAGERRKLNLGHTFAHAIEHKANSPAKFGAGCGSGRRDGNVEVNGEKVGTTGSISHGEAVAMGLAMAARLSVRLGIAPPQVEADVLRALEVCGLPAESPYPVESLLAAMRKDKKAEAGIVHTVLIRSIGDVVVRDMRVDEIGQYLQ